MKRQNKRHAAIILQSLAAVFAVIFVTAFACNDEVDNPRSFDNGSGNPQKVNFTQDKKGVGEKYGSRDPRTCENTKAPAKGAITAELAAKYLICKVEIESGGQLYLVEDVKVEVGKGRPFNPNTDNISDADVNVPVYPIRGSYIKYYCTPEERESNPRYNTVGKNCTKQILRKAQGLCNKTTFGDWDCFMSDYNVANEDKFYNIPPPKKADKAPNDD